MESKNKELRDKIVLGVKLAVSKLIERKRESMSHYNHILEPLSRY